MAGVAKLDFTGIPVREISWGTAGIVIAFLFAGVVLTLTNHPDQANMLFGVSVGAVGGSAGTAILTAKIQANNKNGD